MEPDHKSEWPWWGQLILAVIALFLALVLLVALPVASVLWLGDGGGQQAGVWEPMIASLLALTSLLVTGIFLFMTFRIDRGTKLEAERTAKETATEIATRTATETATKTSTETATKTATEIATETATKTATKTATEIATEIAKETAKETTEGFIPEIRKHMNDARQGAERADEAAKLAEQRAIDAESAKKAANDHLDQARNSLKEIEGIKSLADSNKFKEQVSSIVQEELEGTKSPADSDEFSEQVRSIVREEFEQRSWWRRPRRG